MHRFPAFSTGSRHDSGSTVPIWEPGRFGARLAGATAGLRASSKRPGFERAAEDPLGARE